LLSGSVTGNALVLPTYGAIAAFAAAVPAPAEASEVDTESAVDDDPDVDDDAEDEDPEADDDPEDEADGEPDELHAASNTTVAIAKHAPMVRR
jgi:hypothetical protein